MKSNRLVRSLFFLSIIFLEACVWVDLKPGGQSVRVVNASESPRCKRVGHVTSETTAEIIGIPRDGESVNNELTRIARNQAADMGGNAVLAIGPVRNGSQNFDVLRCPRSSSK